MEPKRQPGDDRIMWRTVQVRTGDWCVSEHEQDARDVAGDDGMDSGEFIVESVLVTAGEWNAMPEWDGF